MKILVTGGKGQLANEIKSILSAGKSEIGACPIDINTCEATYIDIEELDITKISDVKKYVSSMHFATFARDKNNSLTSDFFIFNQLLFYICIGTRVPFKNMF